MHIHFDHLIKCQNQYVTWCFEDFIETCSECICQNRQMSFPTIILITAVHVLHTKSITNGAAILVPRWNLTIVIYMPSCFTIIPKLVYILSHPLIIVTYMILFHKYLVTWVTYYLSRVTTVIVTLAIVVLLGYTVCATLIPVPVLITCHLKLSCQPATRPCVFTYSTSSIRLQNQAGINKFH